MFIDQNVIPLFALQRSAMFWRDGYAIGHVSLLQSEKNLFKLAFYKHFVPPGRGAVQNVGPHHKSRQKNKKLSVCFTEVLHSGREV